LLRIYDDDDDDDDDDDGYYYYYHGNNRHLFLMATFAVEDAEVLSFS